MNDWSLSSHSAGDRTVVVVTGELDMRTAPRLRQQLTDLVEAGEIELVVDLEGVGMLDSTGLGVLCGALNRVRLRGGSLHIVCSNPKIIEVFETTGLTRVFPLHDSLERALTA